MASVVLALGLALHAALAVQALTAHHRGSHQHDDEARLAAAIETSIRASLKAASEGAELKSNFAADDDYIAGLLGQQPPGFRRFDDGVAEAGQRVRRSAEPEGGADRDVEEVTEAEGDEGDDEQPPATGIRRWVIRIRNVMFGRRDLEGTEDGEAEGEPETGRTWVESLAHWFAHGIKALLLRISGGDGAEEAGEEAVDVATDVAAPRPSPTPAPSPEPTAAPSRATKRRPTPGTGTGTSTGRSAPTPGPAPTPPMPWTALPPLAGTGTASTAPKAAATTPAATVYDDEAFGGARGSAVETNELN